MSRTNEQPVVFDDDNPEWTEQDFARAQPLSAFPELEAALKVNKGGRPGQDKEQVTLRIDRVVLAHFRAGGRGWQTRLNDALKQTIGG